MGISKLLYTKIYERKSTTYFLCASFCTRANRLEGPLELAVLEVGLFVLLFLERKLSVTGSMSEGDKEIVQRWPGLWDANPSQLVRLLGLPFP